MGNLWSWWWCETDLIFWLENRDDYEPEDDTVGAGRKESNFTVLTINEIMDEQMSQISRVAELFEVCEGGSGGTLPAALPRASWNVLATQMPCRPFFFPLTASGPLSTAANTFHLAQEGRRLTSKFSSLFFFASVQVPPATARQLLTHMKWNVDRLIECYYGGEADELFTKGGIADPRNANSAMVRNGLQSALNG